MRPITIITAKKTNRMWYPAFPYVSRTFPASSGQKNSGIYPMVQIRPMAVPDMYFGIPHSSNMENTREYAPYIPK